MNLNTGLRFQIIQDKKQYRLLSFLALKAHSPKLTFNQNWVLILNMGVDCVLVILKKIRKRAILKVKKT
jgi:hypothetical protein